MKVLFLIICYCILGRADLPRCIDSQAAVDVVLASMKRNPKNPRKYDGYKKVLEKSPPQELLARLAYAETLAANCPQQNQEVASVVVGVLRNRVDLRKGDVFAVVFEVDQFASALNNYKESRYRDFLCPEDLSLWKTISAELLEKDGSLPSFATNYYFFRHSARHKPPLWASGPNAYKAVVLPISEGDEPCIRAFINPTWL